MPFYQDGSFISANFKNMIDGGDFTVNPWQRNVPGLASAGVISTAITNTVTYFADRFAMVGGASSAILASKIVNTTVAGFNAALRFQRQSANANLAQIYCGQVLETADSLRCQGQVVTLSFWAQAGANFSAAAGALNVQLISGTGSDQSFSAMVGATWTGQANVVNTTIAPSSAAMTRFSVTGTVPIAATQLGVLLSWVPVGTAGSNDNVDIMGMQLEFGSVPTAFEHRDVQVELEICQRYAWLVAEPAANVVVGSGSVSATNTEIFYLGTPVQLRIAPTVTTSVGSFKVNSSTGGVVAATGLTGNATHTPNVIGLTATGTGTAGQAALLQGGAGNGWILASADY